MCRRRYWTRCRWRPATSWRRRSTAPPCWATTSGPQDATAAAEHYSPFGVVLLELGRPASRQRGPRSCRGRPSGSHRPARHARRAAARLGGTAYRASGRRLGISSPRAERTITPDLLDDVHAEFMAGPTVRAAISTWSPGDLRRGGPRSGAQRAQTRQGLTAAGRQPPPIKSPRGLRARTDPGQPSNDASSAWSYVSSQLKDAASTRGTDGARRRSQGWRWGATAGDWQGHGRPCQPHGPGVRATAIRSSANRRKRGPCAPSGALSLSVHAAKLLLLWSERTSRLPHRLRHTLGQLAAFARSTSIGCFNHSRPRGVCRDPVLWAAVVR